MTAVSERHGTTFGLASTYLSDWLNKLVSKGLIDEDERLTLANRLVKFTRRNPP